MICESRSHILDWEMATTAVFSGCLVRAVPTERGTLNWKDIEPVIYKRGAFRAATGLIEIENTANLAGGRCTTLAAMKEIWENAKDRKLPVHLDGGPIFNASTTLGVDVKTLTRGFDTTTFCLSKGLCAPVGSMLTGSAELIEQGRAPRGAVSPCPALHIGPNGRRDKHAWGRPRRRIWGPSAGRAAPREPAFWRRPSPPRPCFAAPPSLEHRAPQRDFGFGRGEVAEWLNAPHSKFGSPDLFPFCSDPAGPELSEEFVYTSRLVPASTWGCYRVG